MAKFVLKTPVITVNSVDMSDHLDNVSIETTFDDAEDTAFGATYKSYQQGMGDATITLNFHQDFAASEVDATLWPLSQSGATFPVTIKPFDSAVAATNPLFSMTGRLFSYNPLDGGVGELSTTSVEIRNGSNTGLTRATS